MKKLIASIIVLIITTTISLAQTEKTPDGSIKIEDTISTKVVLSKTYRAKVINMEHKKSNDLISIKAYRKSLQIKVKTVKLC